MDIITDKHEIESVQADLLPRLANDWALMTVGVPGDWNTMTIAWGSMGDMWWQPVVNCWVAPSRYTHSFLERHTIFTVSFFPPEYHDDLLTLGTKSGRDGDKVAQTELTPVFANGTVHFGEAKLVLVCRKLYRAPLTEEGFLDPALVERNYPQRDFHDMYIGEVVKVLVKE